MPGARSVISRQVPPKVFEPKTRRQGVISTTEQALVTQFVLDQPREVTDKQVTALSKVLRRTKEAVKTMVQAAREDFNASADFYVTSHRTAVEHALNAPGKDGDHDPKALDVAARASQWALENLSAEGQRVVDKLTAGKGDMGPRILVGINLGGLNTTPVVETTVLEGVVDPPISTSQKPV